MTKLISTFSHYAGRAADRMGVPENETLVRACVELMFNIMVEQKAICIKNPLDRYRFAEQATAEWISPRYEAYKKYAFDFFKSAPSADYDAIIVAMLCTGYTDMAHLPIGNEDPNVPTIFRNDSIDFDIIKRAETIITQAEIIFGNVIGEGQNFKDDIGEPLPESVYLAHGFLGDLLYQSQGEGYDQQDSEDLQDFKDNILCPIRNFVHSYTALGQELIQHIDAIEAYLQAMEAGSQKPTATNTVPVTKDRPKLTLV